MSDPAAEERRADWESEDATRWSRYMQTGMAVSHEQAAIRLRALADEARTGRVSRGTL